MKVSEHLYLYLWADQRENNCNSIVIDGKVPTLIDPGHAHHVPGLFDRMREDGFDPESLRLVICTHAHPDHVEGATSFASNRVRIAMSRKSEHFIEEVGRPMYAQQGMTVPEYRVDLYLKEGDLTLGKHEFQVLETPGHSPGSICLYWTRYRVLICGDVVFMQGVGRADLPGGDGPTLRQTIERLSTIPVELLIPGHGPAIQGSERVRENFDLVKRMYFGAL
jgi:glyoxylase-like metal-dependent hydrolase (beta-lactamase superfamily II)